MYTHETFQSRFKLLEVCDEAAEQATSCMSVTNHVQSLFYSALVGQTGMVVEGSLTLGSG
jgi:hypothetical protein